ncbi:MAG TPA: sigma-70 family RNA polymerase sigma factor [Planctomycetota bacterium]|nr:sigma-70 family RNA polymerase sigma factor [Planctomycetota bacterium]
MATVQTLTPTEEEDIRLLHAVAQTRDHAAFDELFKRHHRAAYNLALHICADSAVAEETVQEAMMRVWASAKTFQREGSVRAWILKIVARECIRLAKLSRKTQGHMQRELEDSERSVADQAADAEAATELRKRILELPELDRQLVGLHFGGGLTQREIGDALSMPQQTVSFRLAESLRRLRSSLATAGFASAGAFLDSGGIERTLSSGVQTPPALVEKVLADLPARAAAEAAYAAASKAGAAVTQRIVSTLAIGAAAIGLVYLLLPGAPASKPPASKPAPAPVVQTVAPRFERTWSFEDGPLPEFKLLQGEWVWEKQGDGVGAMNVTSTAHALVPLPAIVPPRPLKVVITMYAMNRAGEVRHNLLWTGPERFAVYHNYLRPIKVMPARLGVYEPVCYAAGRHIISYYAGQVDGIFEYEKDYAGDRFCMIFHNIAVRKIHIAEIDEDELPQDMRDMPSLVKNFGGTRTPGSASGHSLPLPNNKEDAK